MNTQRTPAPVDDDARSVDERVLWILHHLGNGGVEQVAAYLAGQPVAARAEFLDRCAALAEKVAAVTTHHFAEGKIG